MAREICKGNDVEIIKGHISRGKRVSCQRQIFHVFFKIYMQLIAKPGIELQDNLRQRNTDTRVGRDNRK